MTWKRSRKQLVALAAHLISDLRAATTAWESCTILPVEDTLPLVFTLPVPRATTWNPAAVGRRREGHTVTSG